MFVVGLHACITLQRLQFPIRSTPLHQGKALKSLPLLRHLDMSLSDVSIL